MILNKGLKHSKKYITYADAAKLPPQPQPQSSTATNTNTNTNSNTIVLYKQKNDNLNQEEIMTRSKHIIGIFPMNMEDLERIKCDTKAKTLMKTAI